mmetsp:Transcript_11572/g.32476  ORF Transcript_11572/g.32476 Transcript_11572/m.32476 type:complete len:275 (-) Transcript_11572:193-1017(-)
MRRWIRKHPPRPLVRTSWRNELLLLVLQSEEVRQRRREQLLLDVLVLLLLGLAAVVRDRAHVRRAPQLALVVSEEAHQPVALGSVRAHLRAVPRGVEPALKDPVSILARVAALARPFPVVRTRHRRVVVLPWVSPSSLLSRVSKRALRPVVRTCPRTGLHLEVVHAKVVARELRALDIKYRLVRVARIVWVVVFVMLLLLLVCRCERVHLCGINTDTSSFLSSSSLFLFVSSLETKNSRCSRFQTTSKLKELSTFFPKPKVSLSLVPSKASRGS